MATNTREILGEQETLDKLVAKDSTLTSFVENDLTTMREYAFRGLSGLTSIDLSGATSLNHYALLNCSALTSVTAPNLTLIWNSALSGCTALETLDLIGAGNTSDKALSIDPYTFSNAKKFKHFLIRNSVKATLNNSNAFENTLIGVGEGAIYVPNDLLASYKADTKWSKFNLYPLEDYPKTNFDTIEDSWTTIIANVNNDDYADKYHVGDTKTVNIGENSSAKMQIVYIGDGSTTGEDYDGNGTIKKTKISWLCKNFYTKRQFNSSMVNWPNSSLYSWLNTDSDGIYNTIDSTVKAAIKQVKKPYWTTSGAEAISNDYIWIPSYQEVMFGTDKEISGVQYSDIFGSTTSTSGRTERVKYNLENLSAEYWWLRSAYSSHYQCNVNSGGSCSNGIPSNSGGVVFGFAI